MVNVKQIKQLLKANFKTTGKVVIDPITGKVNVAGDVMFIKQINQLPVTFGDVGGSLFWNNNQLTTLVGAPSHVGGDFYCDRNQLTSLVGAPIHVGRDFFCNHNKLTSLAGAPLYVGGNFSCGDNQLSSLSGAPQHVGGDFFCNNNQLTSLTGAPLHVGGYFNCRGNPFTSLAGAPNNVGSVFWCDYDDHLPLLRLLTYEQIKVLEAPDQIHRILQKYAGLGKKGAILAAAEMIKAGYKENARW